MRKPAGNGKTPWRVTYACGHSETVALYAGNAAGQWLTQLESNDCSACWLKKQPPVFSLRMSAAKGPAIDVSRGYPIREELKQRGYYFKRPSWMKWFRNEAEREQELAWARSCGYQISD
jgi:hypothetical protein